jgi:putative membrane protein
MQATIRRRLPLVTGLLTVVSLVAVIAAVRQAVPAALLPPIPEPLLAAIPHVNALLSAVAIVTILFGWRAIRAGRVETHRRAMIASLGLFLGFLSLYLLRVAIEGPTAFEGPEWFKLWLYYPILGIHMALAIICLPLLYHVLLLGVTHTPSELSETLHPRLGRIAATLWLVSFTLGIVVYLVLYVRPLLG